MGVISGTIRDGVPFLFGLVLLPDLKNVGSVEFLVDTGASQSCLHPADARTLGIDLSSLAYTRRSQGVGGYAAYSPHNAYILFPGGKPEPENLELQIAEPNDLNLNLPSLLGRDIISRWRMLYAPSSGELRFDY